MMAGMITLILIGLLRGIETTAPWSSKTSRCGTNWPSSSVPRRVRGSGFSDRLLWVLLSHLWRGWAAAVSVVQPAAVGDPDGSGPASSSSGPGRPPAPDRAARPSPRRSARSSDGCRDTCPVRDRDGVYGVEFFEPRCKASVVSTSRRRLQSPWQNPYVERLPIGTLRRECLDHIVIMNRAPPASPFFKPLSRLLPQCPNTPRPWTRTRRSRDQWSALIKAGSWRRPWSEACIIGAHAPGRVISLRPPRAVPATRKSPVGPVHAVPSIFLRLASVGSTRGCPSEPRPSYFGERPHPVLRIPGEFKRKAHAIADLAHVSR